jgi:dolichol-phosphate mannosyltransferase
MSNSDPVTKLGLVVPTLNEAGNMELLLARVRSALAGTAMPYEVLVVDDDSEDGTQDVVEKCAETDSRIRLLQRRRQKGLAGAVTYGWQRTDADLVGVMDADLQHPPELLPALLAAIGEGHDIAIGSRYARGNRVDGWNPVRLALSRVTTWATLPFQKKNLHIADPMSGFFLVRRQCIEGLDLQPEGFKILLEILVRGSIRSAAEVPFHFGTRHDGKSKADARVAFHYFTLLGKLSRELIFGPESR